MLTTDINVLSILYNEEMDVKSNKPFNYYKYMGSNTQPPCAEHVVWFVAADVIPVGSTVLAMFRDSLNVPGLDTQ